MQQEAPTHTRGRDNSKHTWAENRCTFRTAVPPQALSWDRTQLCTHYMYKRGSQASTKATSTRSHRCMCVRAQASEHTKTHSCCCCLTACSAAPLGSPSVCCLLQCACLLGATRQRRHGFAAGRRCQSCAVAELGAVHAALLMLLLLVLPVWGSMSSCRPAANRHWQPACQLCCYALEYFCHPCCCLGGCLDKEHVLTAAACGGNRNRQHGQQHEQEPITETVHGHYCYTPRAVPAA